MKPNMASAARPPSMPPAIEPAATVEVDESGSAEIVDVAESSVAVGTLLLYEVPGELLLLLLLTLFALLEREVVGVVLGVVTVVDFVESEEVEVEVVEVEVDCWVVEEEEVEGG